MGVRVQTEVVGVTVVASGRRARHRLQRAAGASPPLIEQLLSLGVTPGAFVTMMQRFPSVVFLCDHTELAVERMVADVILVRPLEDWYDPAVPEIRH